MDSESKHHDTVCPTCRDILLGETGDASKGWVKATSQTFDMFVDAAQKKCAICSVMWYFSRKHRQSCPPSPELWRPLTFKAWLYPSGLGGDNIIGLEVLHLGAPEDKPVDARFFLVPMDEAEYQEQLDFSAFPSAKLPAAKLATGLEWLNHCRASHLDCEQMRTSPGTWQPTRLLDVGIAGSTTWRLREKSQNQDEPPVPYLTLSYRWGPTPPLRLLSSNITTLRHDQPIDDLPLLFRDVINVAHSFSVQYVWIDALCIIQDSQEDWEREASRMQHVYSNSVCTIAASASENPDDSLYHTRDVDFIRPGMVESSLFATTKTRPYCIYDDSYWDRQIFDGPLHNRGWAFQERFLSPRVLYFGRHQILWECLSQHRCEVFLKGIPTYMSDKKLNPLMEYRLGRQSAVPGTMTPKLTILWGSVVQRYTSCALTKPSDKLHAMAGVAKLFEEYTGDEYVAGLWKSKLVTMLEWGVTAPKPRLSSEFRAPSWSWASIDGPVLPWIPAPESKPLIEVVRCSVETRTSDATSSILSASLVLKGRLVPIICLSSDQPFLTLSGSTGKFSVQVYPDSTDVKFEQGCNISYLPLSLNYIFEGSEGKTIPCVVCLILERDGQSSNGQAQYRRLGHLAFYGSSGYDLDTLCLQPPIQDVTIV